MIPTMLLNDILMLIIASLTAGGLCKAYCGVGNDKAAPFRISWYAHDFI